MTRPNSFNTLTPAEWKQELSKALELNSLFLVYQPKVVNREVVGFEGLCRWNHSDYGMIPPDVFICEAERTLQIQSLGEFVVKEACRFIIALESLGSKATVSVNVSPVQLMNGRGVDFSVFLRKTCEEQCINPSKLIIEITESAEIERDDVLSSLKLISSNGHKLALDDFGTGYSSYGVFNRLDIDYLKIDRSFVTASATPKGAVIISSIVELGQKLGMGIVVEGVETVKQHEFLQRYGDLILQGYLYSPPLNFEDALIKAT